MSPAGGIVNSCSCSERKERPTQFEGIKSRKSRSLICVHFDGMVVHGRWPQTRSHIIYSFRLEYCLGNTHSGVARVPPLVASCARSLSLFDFDSRNLI